MGDNYGQRVAAAAITERLSELLPAIPAVDGLDWAVIADELVRTVSLQAIDTINARERGLQEALVATMAYMSSVIDDLRGRIGELEDERKTLHLRLAGGVEAKDEPRLAQVR